MIFGKLNTIIFVFVGGTYTITGSSKHSRDITCFLVDSVAVAVKAMILVWTGMMLQISPMRANSFLKESIKIKNIMHNKMHDFT